jgi:hypothetical protein
MNTILEEDARSKYDRHAHCLCTRMHQQSYQCFLLTKLPFPRGHPTPNQARCITSCPSEDSLPHELQYTPLKIKVTWGARVNVVRRVDSKVLHVLQNVENYSPNDIQSRTPGDLNLQQQRRTETQISHSKRGPQFWLPIQNQKQCLISQFLLHSHAPHNDVSVNDGPHMRRW